MAKRAKSPPKEHLEAIQKGWQLLAKHALFGRLAGLAWLKAGNPDPPLPPDGYVRVTVAKGYHYGLSRSGARFDYSFGLVANGWKRATPPEWANILAQALLHIAMGHVDPVRDDLPWRTACELMATDLLRHLGAGQRPTDLGWPDVALPARTLEAIAGEIAAGGEGALATYGGCGVAGVGQPGWVHVGAIPPFDAVTRRHLAETLAGAIRANIVAAVETAGSAARGPASGKRNSNSLAERARAWFIASYPLLAALAAAFEIVEDVAVCEQLDIRIAAVDPESRRVYINPKFPWTPDGMRFVMAHELLHVGLSHAARRQGRDHYLWNIACDYVINGWLVEMGVGAIPTDGLMLDPELGLERESAEAIYDRIVKDLRLSRRLGKAMTLRGVGKPDLLGERPPGWWTGPGCDLDTFYRRALAEGLDLHCRDGSRGLLPGDLVEEVRALLQPPIPWDVQLGQWLDRFFPPLERRRSYARASRRQSATPDIPRPVYQRPLEAMAQRTFGVVVDTSGSMARMTLARAFGAIASYAMSREVPLVRIVQCDAGIHDMGYVEAERLFERIEVRGRGGTVLRPAVERLEQAENFPRDAPILLITDGMCDTFTVRREHAFLLPTGCRLPFRTSAPVFLFDGGEEPRGPRS